MRTHLLAAAEEMGEAEALRLFGTPAATARSIVRQARGFDTRRVATLAVMPGFALAAALTACEMWMRRGMSEMGSMACLWIPFIALLLFAARCYGTRRWLAPHVALWSAAGFA